MSASIDAPFLWQVSVNSRTEVYHRPELDKIKSVRERLRDDPKTWDAYMEEQRARVRAVKDVRFNAFRSTHRIG